MSLSAVGRGRAASRRTPAAAARRVAQQTAAATTGTWRKRGSHRAASRRCGCGRAGRWAVGCGREEMGDGGPAAGRAWLCGAWQRRLPFRPCFGHLVAFLQRLPCDQVPCCSAHPLHQLPTAPSFHLLACLQEIYYFHQAIRSALHSFAAEARALRAAEGRVTTAQVHLGRTRPMCRFAGARRDLMFERSSSYCRGVGCSMNEQPNW